MTDVKSGKTVYSLDADRISFTGSTRKLSSVGVALDALGARHRESRLSIGAAAWTGAASCAATSCSSAAAT